MRVVGGGVVGGGVVGMAGRGGVCSLRGGGGTQQARRAVKGSSRADLTACRIPLAHLAHARLSLRPRLVKVVAEDHVNGLADILVVGVSDGEHALDAKDITGPITKQPIKTLL